MPLVVLTVGLILGAGLWLWLFSLAFTRSLKDFYEAAIGPLFLSMFTSGMAGVLAPRSWLLFAAALSTPTAVLNLMFFSKVRSEANSWHWIYVAVAVVLLTLAGAALGRIARHIFDGTRAHRER